MKANDVALKFYQQKPVSSRFITAKQCDWLMQSARYDKQDFRDHRGGAQGRFEIDGKSYFWELHIIRHGAGSFSITTPDDLDAFHQELVQREKDHRSLLMDWALETMLNQDWSAAPYIVYEKHGAICEGDWLS